MEIGFLKSHICITQMPSLNGEVFVSDWADSMKLSEENRNWGCCGGKQK